MIGSLRQHRTLRGRGERRGRPCFVLGQSCWMARDRLCVREQAIAYIEGGSSVALDDVTRQYRIKLIEIGIRG